MLLHPHGPVSERPVGISHVQNIGITVHANSQYVMCTAEPLRSGRPALREAVVWSHRGVRAVEGRQRHVRQASGRDVSPAAFAADFPRVIRKKCRGQCFCDAKLKLSSWYNSTKCAVLNAWRMRPRWPGFAHTCRNARCSTTLQVQRFACGGVFAASRCACDTACLKPQPAAGLPMSLSVMPHSQGPAMQAPSPQIWAATSWHRLHSSAEL